MHSGRIKLSYKIGRHLNSDGLCPTLTVPTNNEFFWPTPLYGANGVCALQPCQAALERASLLTFTSAPAAELARTTSVDELLLRIETINSKQDVPSTEALSGRISRPKPNLTEALVYIDEIAARELTDQS